MKTKIPFVDLRAAQEEMDGELEVAVARVLDSGWYLLGPELEAFEREFADYCGARHCVGVGSGLSALELTLRAAGVGPGDEVIVPAYTWVATWLAVSLTGARPVGVDVLEETYNIDPARVGGGDHRADRGDHAGAPARRARRHGGDREDRRRARPASLIEDAAQAHGARCAGRRPARSATPRRSPSTPPRTSARWATAARSRPTTTGWPSACDCCATTGCGIATRSRRWGSTRAWPSSRRRP